MSSPTVLVEIAFNAGYTTPAASRTWTNVSAYVLESSKIAIAYGRPDELAHCDANSLALTLDNSDGRFTWGKASSPYYPNVKVGRPIRVTVGGSVRFTGYINEWPVEWPGTVTTFATTATSASSRLARLGLNSPLKSVIQEEILRDSPVVYYTMGEPSGATQANDSSGNSGPALQQAGTGTAVTFGTATGPGTDDLTAAQFAGGKYLVADPPSGNSDLTLEAFIVTTTNSVVVAYVSNLSFEEHIGFRINSSGNAVGFQNSGGAFDLLTGTTVVTDGAVHHLCLKAQSIGTATLYVDGVAEATDTFASWGSSAARLTVGAGDISLDGLTGSVAHVALWDELVSDARIAEHADAGLTGFAGETTNERLARYATWTGIPAAEVVAAASTITLDHIDSTGVQAVEMMRKIETAEAGVLHDNRDGNLELESRSARYNAAVAVTLDASSGQVGVDYKPSVDRSSLYTIGEAQNIDGTASARYTDETDRDEYGDSTYSVTTAAQGVDEPLYLAAWVVNANSSPRPRAPQVTVNLMPYVEAGTTAPLVALDVGSKVRISNAPSQAPATTADYFVEGYSETVGASVWTLTLNLSPGHPYDDVLILDSATDGLLDTNLVAL